MEVKDDEKNKEDIFDVIAPSEPIDDRREQGEEYGEVEFIPGTLLAVVEQVCLI